MEDREEFYWGRHPEIESLFFHYLDSYSRKNRFLSDFRGKIVRRTSAGFLNWIDHIRVLDSAKFREQLQELGFEKLATTRDTVYTHSGVLLPDIVLVEKVCDWGPGITLRVENIEDFSEANHLETDIEGSGSSPCRRMSVAMENGIHLWAIERRGTRDFDPAFPENGPLRDFEPGLAAWKNLDRSGDNESKAWQQRNTVVEDLVSRFGAGPAAHIVCRCEREYWLSRNSTGRVQKLRQDELGLGWANQDHHTFRSSRRNFSKLIHLFLKLGFHKRERFYAGKEAGWGAQVMEHAAAGLSLFLDVDLEPEEIDIDFSTRDLDEKDNLGTVGLWCALHGDSIFEAGMHHLAARYDFEKLFDDLAEMHIRFMPPFSDFTYLKQSFSVAETWQIAPARVRSLLLEKRITEEQAGKFLSVGTVGSHLENIERREGYKGFNRKNVSTIIRDTDPRKE